MTIQVVFSHPRLDKPALTYGLIAVPRVGEHVKLSEADLGGRVARVVWIIGERGNQTAVITLDPVP